MTTHTADRRARLAATLPDAGVDALLVTRLVNVRYLTGFTGSSGAVLVRPDGSAALATDGRYRDQAAEECPDIELVVTRSGPGDLLTGAANAGLGRVGFEGHDVSVTAHRALSEAHPGTLVCLAEMAEPLRVVKDDAELGLLAQACAVSDDALEAVLPSVHVGQSERQIALALEVAMRERGAEGIAFDTIVAGGPNSAIPHHSPTDRPLQAGDFLKIDFGARVDGYHADETRTFVVGAEPAQWQQEVYAVVQAAQAAGVAALSATADPVEVDRAAREVVTAAGYGDRFTHGLGHGVGLEIHEAPFLGSTSTDTLAAAVPVTVEPGVYLPGRGGVRIEDTLLVGADRVRSLTQTTRELTVLGRL